MSLGSFAYRPEELRAVILNSNEPLLFKDVLTPDILKWNLDDWASILKNEFLEFRLGKFTRTLEPQWESTTEVIKSSFERFLQCTTSEDNTWLYFDYKYLKNWLTNCEELRKNISWAPLGFPEVTVNDCTIWIGTKGAHTPCHVDTYGFNLIFQVYGKKLWVVAPPEENLKPTRIPYEESSVYSKLNFFSPNIENFKGINNCRKIVLNPGEVLYLPHKWWHYVENLETAISINVWIPLPQDDDERLKESIVQLFVKQFVDTCTEISNDILNPNMKQSLLNSDVKDILEITNQCKKICKDTYKNKKSRKDYTLQTKNKLKTNESDVLEKHNFIEKLPKLSQEDLILFLEEQGNRFKDELNNVDSVVDNDIAKFLNVLTDSDVVSLISKKLLES